MRTWLIALVLCWSLAYPQDVKTSGEQLLKSAADVVNIRANNAKPFQLDCDFVAQGQVPLNGHATLKWSAKDLWSEEVTMGEYKELRILKGDSLYISRNLPYTPMRVGDLEDLLDLNIVPRYPEDWAVKKVRSESIDGKPVECVEFEYRVAHSARFKRDLCIDSATHEPVSDGEAHTAEAEHTAFSEYQNFRDHRYPGRMVLTENGSPVVKVSAIALKDATFSDSDFNPLPGATLRRTCEHMIHAVALKTPNPIYPRSAGQHRMGGTSTVAITILPDGSVGDVYVIENATKEMDRVTQEAVKKWKFKPAMCGDEPITSVIWVKMHLNPR